MEGIRNRNNDKQEVEDNNRNTALQNSAHDVSTDSEKQTLGKTIELLYRNWKVILCGVVLIVSLLILNMLLDVYSQKLHLENAKVQQETEQLRMKDMQGKRELEVLKLEVEKEQKKVDSENQERSREYDLKVKQAEYDNEKNKERMKNEHSEFILNHKTENVKIVTDTIQELNKATVITKTKIKSGILSSETEKWEEVNRLRIDQKTEQDLNRLLESIEDDDDKLKKERRSRN